MPDFDKIQAIHEADSPEDTQYVVRRNNVIVALRLRLPKNPRAKANPAEVWVGDGPIVKTWGNRLAQKRGKLRLYVAKDNVTEQYADMGSYKVVRRDNTNDELAEAQAQVKHGLSRIVYLEKLPQVAPS